MYFCVVADVVFFFLFGLYFCPNKQRSFEPFLCLELGSLKTGRPYLGKYRLDHPRLGRSGTMVNESPKAGQNW